MAGFAEASGRPALDSIGTAAALGLASGFLSALIFKFEFDPIFWTGLVDQEFLGLRNFPYPILIALCFAGAVSLVIRSVASWRWWTPLLLAVGTYVAWVLAVRSALAVNEAIPSAAGKSLTLMGCGAVAGLVGATATVLTVMAVVPRLRSLRSVATVGLAGMMTGPLLSLPFSVNDTVLWRLAVFFMAWQLAVAAALALSIRMSERADDTAPAQADIAAAEQA